MPAQPLHDLEDQVAGAVPAAQASGYFGPEHHPHEDRLQRIAASQMDPVLLGATLEADERLPVPEHRVRGGFLDRSPKFRHIAAA